MSTPGFTAEAALGEANGTYRMRGEVSEVSSGVVAAGVSGLYVDTFCINGALQMLYVDIHDDGTMTGHHVSVGSC